MLKLSGQINFIRKGLDSTRLLKVTFNKDYPTVLRRKAIFFSEESEIPEGFSAVFINKTGIDKADFTRNSLGKL